MSIALVLTVVLGMLLSTTASGQPQILHGPAVDAITYTSARVIWVTDTPSSTEIRFGTSSGVYDGITTGFDNVTVHSWYLSGLAPGTTYHFQVCSGTGLGKTCSGDQSVTTTFRENNIPLPPEPPRMQVDTSMPSGSYGDPFVIEPDCSNLRGVLSELEALSGDLNYEVRMPAGTVCRGQFVFPARPNHAGWVIVRSTESDSLPEGTRLTADATPRLATFITDAAPAAFNVIGNIGTSCFPDSLFWALNTPGMALLTCKNESGLGAQQTITNASWSGTDAVIVTLPGHGYASGEIVRVTGTNVGVDNTYWRITVLDADRFSLDGSRGRGTYSGSGTVARNQAWRQVPFTSGETLPEACTANEFFFRTNVSPTTEAVYWCTGANKWTNLRMINTSSGPNFSAIQFAERAARYRFVGIEVTHIPAPDPPPPGWFARNYMQGNIGSLITTKETNSHIIFDRCDIHGLDFPSRLAVAVNLDGSNVAIIHSRIHKVNRWSEGTGAVNLESFAINIGLGPGPGKIENNFLEAIGITIFFPESGLGAYHRTPQADYEIVRNYISHPLQYLRGSPQNTTGKLYQNRHHLELKRGRRMLVEGNIFDGNWADVNQGAFVMLSPRPGSVPAAKPITTIQDGLLTVSSTQNPYQAGMLVYVSGSSNAAINGLWQVESMPDANQVKLANAPAGSSTGGSVVAVASDIQISDIDFRNNIFRYGPNVLWILGHENGTSSALTTKTTQRIRFANNLVYGMDVNLATPGSAFANGRPGILAFAAFGMEDLLIRNNTISDFKGSGPTLLFQDSTLRGANGGLDVSENIFIAPGAIMARISGTAFGDRALDAQWAAHPFPSWNFGRNVFCCTTPELRRQRNTMNAPNMWIDAADAVGFSNIFTGDFRLSVSSQFKGGRFCLPGLPDCWTTGIDPGVDMDELERQVSPNNPPVIPQ